MIDNIAKKMVIWQIKKDYLSKKNEKLFIYAYGLLIGQLINAIVTCILAIIFHSYLIVLVFLISFIPLRIYAGGYHARTYDMCTLASTVLICIVCLITKIIPHNILIEFNLTVGVISGVLIFSLAPIEDYNKPLVYVEKECYKKRSRAIWIIETMAWLICYCINAKSISLSISFSHFVLAIMLCLGSIGNYRKRESQI